LADGRHLDNPFLAISQRRIAQLMGNWEGWSRTACRHLSVTWQKLPIAKLQDGGRPPFYKWL